MSYVCTTWFARQDNSSFIQTMDHANTILDEIAHPIRWDSYFGELKWPSDFIDAERILVFLFFRKILMPYGLIILFSHHKFSSIKYY